MISRIATNIKTTIDTVRLGSDTLRDDRTPRPQPAYYLLWRTGWSHPWHSEELDNRTEAHARYFALIERGYEAYLERRGSVGPS